jgi:transposase
MAENTVVARKTVRPIARRYEEEGLESALYENPRPGKARALNTGQSQRIVAMVCGPPISKHQLRPPVR